MKRRDAMLALFAAALVVMALLAVFAIELSNTQAKSKADVKARVHERAVLAGALIDSLFQSVEQQLPQETKTFGTRTVSTATMNRNQQQDAYVALLDRNGQVIAHSRGFTPQAQTDLRYSAALRIVRTGKPYGLGNVLPYGNQGVINLAAVLPTAYGPRILLTGFRPQSLTVFLAGELQRIPGVKGSRNYLIDGNRTVLASTNPARPPGYTFNTPAQIKALSHASGTGGGFYFDQVQLVNSTWKIILAAPTGPLFATVTGVRKWVPWLIFLAFALVALVALALGRRTLRAADQLQVANLQLESVNGQLADANSALERRAAELSRSNLELERFASIASHDLQEPLRKVRTFTEQITVSEADRLSDKGRDYLARTNGAAARMQKLIEDLLKYSRVATHGHPFEQVDLQEVTREVLDDLDVQVARAHAHVEVGELPTINGDALQLRQLMQNLISNALKFHNGGATPEVKVDGELTGGNAVITVADNGIGFDQQYARRIFRVFERLHGRNDYPGTGIGLALCRRIVERHGGSISAQSTEGGGATFTITLPVAATHEALPALHHHHENGSAAEEEINVHA